MELSCIVYLSTILVVNAASELSSLTFVIDSTGSMWHDIEEIHASAGAIFDTMLEYRNESQIDNFIIVTYNDWSETRREHNLKVAKTKDRGEFKLALSGSFMDGGGDCPELAMAGIHQGLEESLPRSSLFVFTDATAKDYDMFEQVKKLALMKQSQIVFVLTGACQESFSSVRYMVYEDLAIATDGQVFHCNKKEIFKVLQYYMKKTITGKRTTIARTTLLPGAGSVSVTYFYGYPTMKEVVVSMASMQESNPVMNIRAPDGRPIPTEQIFKTAKAEAFSVILTKPGIYTVEVNISAETRLLVSTKSEIDFQHGFSSFIPSSPEDTSVQPAPE